MVPVENSRRVVSASTPSSNAKEVGCR